MSRKSELNADKLSFTDISSNVGDIGFSEGAFTINKPISCSNGLSASLISVSNGGTIAVSSLSNLKLAGSTSGEITVQAADTTTDYTIKMPNQQGGVSTVLTNDGTGNLSWGAGGGGGGNTFNQSLNTTDNVQFNNLSLTGTISGISNIVNGVGTDNAIVRFDTNGNTLQNSSVSISDDGNITTSSAIHFSENTNPPTGVDSTARLYASSSSLLFVKQNGDLIDLADGGSVFTGATSIADGTSGLVPQPLAGDQDFYLKGDGTWQSPVVTVSNAANGSQTAPSYSFSSDPNTGMYSSAADNLDFATGGSRRLNISSDGLRLNMSGSEYTPAYSFFNNNNTGMYSSSLNNIDFATGGQRRLNITNTGIRVIQNGLAGAPSYSFTVDPNTGMYLSGSEELSFSTSGSARLSLLSNGNINIRNNKIINSSSTSFNTQYGTSALNSITTGSNNTAIGYQALQNITDKNGLTAVGYQALSSNTTGGFNTCIGYRAGASLTSSNHMTALGYNACQNCNGDDNVGIGAYACSSTSGNRNTCLGNFCGDYNSTGSNNTMIGYTCRINSPLYTVNRSVGIGSECVLRDSNEVVLGDEIYTNKIRSGRNGDVSLGTSAYRFSVVYAATGTINTSDSRQKIIDGESIGLDELMKLKPVKYKWIENGVRNHYGFIAQDIETLINNGEMPDSGLFIKTGISENGNDINLKDITDETKIKQFNYGLRYSELIAPLVKSVQELNNKVKELEQKVNLLESK